MDISTLTGSAPATQVGDTGGAFRKADFLAIMLAELANQDPFEPQETSKLVENMQKLQELANTEFERFREDMRFAQELVGQGVAVGQSDLTEVEAQLLRDRGLNPNVGIGVVEGQVETYKVINEQVWVTIDGQDYEVDNIQKMLPPEADSERMVGLADGLIGRYVEWLRPEGGLGGGVASDVRWTQDGKEVTVTVDGENIEFGQIRRIGQAASGL
ncbi:MAG: hypothetical protein PF961_05165 [Planctomycetota bacterium]|jgi:flagellar hook assembly protein FlgD|nr:hypothetical protein [Planctomycetota bacterium]